MHQPNPLWHYQLFAIAPVICALLVIAYYRITDYIEERRGK